MGSVRNIIGELVMDETNLAYATMGLWMYFWDPSDWGSAPTGQVPRASRYRWGYRVNYVTQTLLLWALSGWEVLRRWF